MKILFVYSKNGAISMNWITNPERKLVEKEDKTNSCNKM